MIGRIQKETESVMNGSQYQTTSKQGPEKSFVIILKGLRVPNLSGKVEPFQRMKHEDDIFCEFLES